MGSNDGAGVPSLKDALARAQAGGAEVSFPRRTGEVLITWNGIRVRHNNRRKDASRELIQLLRRMDA